MMDKRRECGCHLQCTSTPHVCEKPCVWPDCLTETEHEELIRELTENGL